MAAAVSSLLASTVNAHMVITSPVPYGQDSLNNSPLENDGSDFPCKQRSGVYDVSKMNEIPVGVPQKLSFKGGATHGGGSCQLSVTLDKEPTKDSEWKVIHTILGGCPNSAAGNANGAPTYDGNPSFEYSMPKGMPNGQYTLAWTWFNKIGNREMYMNCAPITVTGGADNNDVYNSLPDMFVINLPREECETAESEDFVFPSPGLYVETAAKTALGSKTSGPNCAQVTIKGKGAGKAGSAPQATGSSGGSSAAAGGSSAEAPAPTSAPIQSVAIPSKNAGAGVAPIGTGNVATVTTMATVTGSSAAQATGSASDSGDSSSSDPASDTSDNSSGGSTSDTSNSSSDSSSGSCSNGSVSCPTDGSIVCIGSNQWGTCNRGCAYPMALAAGTTCSGGTISALSNKRDALDSNDAAEHNCTETSPEKRDTVARHLAQHVRRYKNF